MRTLFLRFFGFFFCLLLLSGFAKSQDLAVFELKTRAGWQKVDTLSLFYVDSNSSLRFEDVDAAFAAKNFRPRERGRAVEVGENGVLWSFTRIKNMTGEYGEFFYGTGFNNFTEVRISKADGSFEFKKAGQYTPASEKEMHESRGQGIGLSFAPGETRDIVLRSRNINKRPLFIYQDIQKLSDHNKFLKSRNLYEGLFHGFMLMMIAYNLLIFFSNREKTYLYYSLYIFFGALYFFFFKGFTQQYLIGEVPILEAYLWVGCVALMPFFYLAFMRRFLETEKLIPKWDKIARLMMGLSLIGLAIEWAILYFTFAIDLVGKISMALTLSEALLSLYIFFLIFRRGEKTVRYFIGGSLMLWIGGLASFVSMYFGIGVSGFSSFWFAQTGMIIELLVFSLGLAYRMRKNKENLIEQLRENQELQLKVNRELEQKVLERTQEISLQKDIIEKKNSDITSAINYAGRIQQAILPENFEIEDSLRHYFIFFRPRDIVSGDFYWFGKISPEKYVLAAIDCTGHGVPGAFMSLIGNDLLNEIVNVRKLEAGNEILAALYTGVRRSLRQDRRDNKDGMDSALCVVNSTEGILEFSGAGNPLFGMQNGREVYIKGDRSPISGRGADELAFKAHRLEFGPGDIFYLFSDGFADQFGGPDNRKYMSRRMRKFLAQISSQSIDNQNIMIEKEFELWKGDYQQTDDVLVIGFMPAGPSVPLFTKSKTAGRDENAGT